MSIYHIIYKTTNLVNNKIYIGKHKTRNKDDFYLGSGIAINRAIKKYGRENFKREILFLLNTEEEMNLKEKELVTEEFCLRKDTYNMMIGGQGGDAMKVYTPEQISLRNRKVSKSIKELWDNMSQEEKSRRGKKTQANSDQIAKGKKVALGRKKYFENETEEQRRIRSEKASLGAKKIIKSLCKFCSKSFMPGNIKRHENSCQYNQDSYRYMRFKNPTTWYIIKDPGGVIYETKSVKQFCFDHNISYYLIKNRIGRVVDDFGKNTNNANAMTYNTIGWCMLEKRLDQIDPTF